MYRWPSDVLLLWSLRAVAALAGAIVLLILVFLLIESGPALLSVGIRRFFLDAGWQPAGALEAAQFNLAPMVIGSVLAMAGAVLLATPLGVFSALFCRFYAPSFMGILYRRVLELLAGIPSVVYGFWGLVVLVPLIQHWQPPGQSLLAAVFILTLMIVPTVALLSDTALRNVPRAYLDGGVALGLSRRGLVCGIALPAARRGIYSAVLLASGRAIGETMAVLMVAGNVVQVPRSAFDPVRTLTANIALELGYAMDHHRAALFVSGLVLMLAITLLVAFASVVGKEQAHA